MKLVSFYNKIYVIHWKILKERKEYLLSKFKEFEISHLVEWVELYQDEKSLEKIKNPFDINIDNLFWNDEFKQHEEYINTTLTKILGVNFQIQYFVEVAEFTEDTYHGEMRNPFDFPDPMGCLADYE
jgi:hypothetical protein